MGVLRCGGRLKNSTLPLDTMHPMILPPEHHVTRLIIDKAIQMYITMVLGRRWYNYVPSFGYPRVDK
jgi:hypothetical protein